MSETTTFPGAEPLKVDYLILVIKKQQEIVIKRGYTCRFTYNFMPIHIPIYSVISK